MDAKKVIKSGVAVVLFSILIVAFAMSGVRDAFKPAQRDTVVRAGNREISATEFKRMFDEQREQISQQQKRPISVDEMVAAGQDQRVLKDTAEREAVMSLILKAGLRASPASLAEQIREIPAFFDQVTGRFDKKAYETRLRENNLTPKLFEERLGDEIVQRQFLNSVASGLNAPMTYGAFDAAYVTENHDASFIFVDASTVPPAPAPTDKELQAILSENASQVMKPEYRQVTVISFSTAKMLPTVTADPAQVEKIFNFRKDADAKPETRTLVQIPAKDQAAAQAIAARLAKGEDAAAVAKSVGAAVIDYADKPKTALPDKKIADAAFGLKQGDATAVKGDLGFAAVKVTAVTAGQTIEFAKVKAEVENEVKARAAEQKVSEQTDKFEEARNSGADAVAAAKTAGGQILTLPPIDRNGFGADRKRPEGVSPQIVQEAFKLAAGQDGDFQTQSKGEYFLVRVDKIIPPAMPTVDEIRTDLVKYYQQRDLSQKLKAKGDALVARIKKGENMDAIAASVGSKVQKVVGLNRTNAQQQQPLFGAPMVNAMMGGKKGDVQIAGAPKPGLFVVRVDDIRPGEVTAMTSLSVRGRDEIRNQLGQELIDAFARGGARSVKVKTFPDRARQAIGAAPLTPAPEENGKAKGKAG